MERNLFAVFSLNATWFQSHGVTERITALVSPAFGSRIEAPMQNENEWNRNKYAHIVMTVHVRRCRLHSWCLEGKNL